MAGEPQAWNGVQWKPEHSAGHVESFFIKLNEPKGPRALWLRVTINNRLGKSPLAETWAIAFNAQTREHTALKETFLAQDCLLSPQGLHLEVGGFCFGDLSSKGSISGADSRISWDLEWDPPTLGAYTPFPPALWNPVLPRNKTVTPMPHLRIRGEAKVNDETWEISGWPGMQGHNWGPRQAHRYAWVHCNTFEGEPDAWFEGLSAQITLGPFTSPFLTAMILHWHGELIPFNTLRNLLNRRSSVCPPSWSFETHTGPWILRGAITAELDEMVGLYYANPDSSTTHCLNSKIARADLHLLRKEGGKETLVASLVSPSGAALEFIVPEADHGVVMAL